MSRDIAPFWLRMPSALKGRVQAAAESNGRSMNAEIVAVLEREYPEPQSDESELAALREKVARLEAALAVTR